MNNLIIKKNELKHKRAMRVRKHLHGSSACPRMCVVKSNKHIQVQLIDDDAGVTLASSGTYSKEFHGTEFTRKNKESARKIGEKIAELAIEKNIKQVIFDRGPFKYHGILASLADAARKKGLEF